MPSKEYYWKHREKCIKESLKWQKDNVEACKKSDEKWNESEKGKIAHKNFREANPEKCKKWTMNWKKNNREKVNKNDRDWRSKNPEAYKESQKRFQKNNPKKMKEYWRKHESKRRALGFEPLNKPFENSEAHHISQNLVIYIPIKIHQNISHCIWTWKNMDKINKLAIQFV